MGRRLGIIASSGGLPSLIIEKAQENGFACVVAAIEGQTDRTIGDVIKPLQWFELWDITGVISYLKSNGVSEVVFAGKIDPRVIYNKEQFIHKKLSNIT